jgi:two-component system response regulator YesN
MIKKSNIALLFPLKNFIKKNSMMFKILLSYILLSIVLFSIFPIVLMNNFSKSYIEKVKSSSQNLVMETYETANVLLSSAYKRFYIMNTQDLDFIKALYNEDFDAYGINSICSKLSDEVMLNPILNSIYIYNFHADRVFSSRTATSSVNDFYDTGATEILKDFKTYKNRMFISRKSNDSNVISIFYNNVKGDGTLTSSLVLNIDAKVLESSLLKQTNNSLSKIYIADNNGYILLPTTDDSINTNYSGDEIFNRISSSSEKTGYFTAKVDGVSNLITYSKSSGLGWNFISMTDYETFLKELTPIKSYTMYVSVLFIIASILVSAYFTNNVYNPFYKLLKDLKNKNGSRSKNESILNEYEYIRNTFNNLNDDVKSLKNNEYSYLLAKKEEFLSELLNGNVFFNDNTEDKISELGLKLKTQNYLAIIFKFDSVSEFTKRYTINDIGIIKYAMTNIITEAFSEKYNIEAIPNGFDYISAIIGIDEFSNKDTEEITSIVNKIQADIERFLKFTVSSSMGNHVNSLLLISTSYKNALQYINYRLITGDNSLINYYDFFKREISHVNYPYNIETDILNSLKKRQQPLIEDNLNKFFDLLSTAAFNEIQMYIAQLIMAIDKDLKSSNTLEFDESAFNFNEIYENSKQLNSFKEIEIYISSKLIALTKDIVDSKQKKNQQIAEIVITYVSENYSDINLSVEAIADYIGLSPNYVRSIFKEITDKSLSTYINEFKINKAIELLKTTDFTAKDISSMVGFNDNRYFYSVFKKFTGFTTEEYKKNLLK